MAEPDTVRATVQTRRCLRAAGGCVFVKGGGPITTPIS